MAVSNKFSSSSLDLNGKVSLSQPTALVWGPDGRLYVTEVDGDVKALTVAFGDPNPGDGDPAAQFYVTEAEILGQVKSIPNFNDDGTPSNSGERQVTGIDVTPQFDPETGAPVMIDGKPAVTLYVSSSDSRIGAGTGGEDAGLDTNSGVITRLTQTETGWVAVDLVRGLARSEENHATNGLEVIQELDEAGNLVSERMIVASGGNANTGAPSNNFAGQQEQPTSAAILEVDLDQLKAMPTETDPTSQRQYIYDLPTLDDPTREDGAENDPFGGNDGLNSAILTADSPVQIYSAGYRNAYDVEVTEDGRVWTYDNGANNNWGGRPAGEDNNASSTDAENGTPFGYIATNLVNEDNTEGAPGGGTRNFNPQNWDSLHEVTRSDDLDGRTLSAGLGGAQTYQWAHPDFDEPLTLVYGGHPNPTRAEGARAGLLYTPKDGVEDSLLMVSNVDKGDGSSDFLEVVDWLSDFGYSDAYIAENVVALEPGVRYSDQFVANYSVPTTPGVFSLVEDADGPVGLPADIDEIVHALNPIEGDYREAGFTDGSVDTGKGSINGMTEYTSSIFDDANQGTMQGALIAASLNQGQYYVIGRDADGIVQTTTEGGRTIAADRSFIQSGGAPLGLASLGDDVGAQGGQAFRGSVWGAIYKENGPVIEVLQPGTADDPLLGEGFYAGQEPFDPIDNDRDGVDHINDPFEFDADNGIALAAGGRIELNFSQVDLAAQPDFSGTIGDTGLLGAALDGSTPNRDAITGTYAGNRGDGAPVSEQRDGLFDNAGNIIPGGNAPILQLKTVREGTAVGEANTLRDGLQTGVRLDDDVQRLAAEVDFDNWWPGQEGGGRVTGVVMGDGTQSNFMRLVWGDVDGSGAPKLRLLIEVDDQEVYVEDFADAAFATAVEGGAGAVTLQLEVSDIGGGYDVAARYKVDGGSFVDLGLDVSLPEGVLRAVLDGDHTISDGDTTLPSGAAVGIVAEKNDGVSFDGVDIPEIRVEAFGNEINAGTGAQVGTPGTDGVDTVRYTGNQTVLAPLADDVENFDGRGSSANYAVIGNALGNEIAVGAGANTVTTGGGADVVRGTREQLAGDTITDFALEDAVLIEGVTLNDLDVSYGAGSAVLGLGDGQAITFDSDRFDDFAPGDGPSTFALDEVAGGVLVTLAPNETVIYRVNAGSNAGPGGTQGDIAALDDGPDWLGDATLTAADGVTITNDNGNTFSSGDVNQESEITFAPGVDAGVVPWELFANERSDNNGATGGELTYTFDVVAGSTYRIDYFYTENWPGYDGASQADRVFDVEVEGAVPSAFDDLFPAEDAEAALAALGNTSPTKADILGTGMVRSHQLVAGDDALSVTLVKQAGFQNPKVNAIQVVQLGGEPQDATAPVVTSITISNPPSDQDSPRTATVVVIDGVGFDQAALDDALDGTELTFAGVVPGSVSDPVVTLSNNGKTATLTYELGAPASGWPDGTGTVSLAAEALADAAGNPIAGGQANFVSGEVERETAVAEGGALFALDFEAGADPLADGGFTDVLGGTAGALEAGKNPRIEGGDLALTTSNGDLFQAGATASKNDFVRAADVSAAGITEVTLASRLANPFDADFMASRGYGTEVPNFLQQGIVVATGGADNQGPGKSVKLTVGGNDGTAIQIWSQGAFSEIATVAAMSAAATTAGGVAFDVTDVATIELGLVIDKDADTVAPLVTFYDAFGATLGGVRPADTPGFVTVAPQAVPADVLAAIDDGTSVFGVVSNDYNEGAQLDDSFEVRWEDLTLTSPQVDDDLPGDRVNGAFQGDFSDDHEAPTDIGTLSEGATTIIATQGGDDAPEGRERDYITFTVAAGQELTGIVITGYEGGEDDAISQGFIAIAQGDQVPLSQAEFEANGPIETGLLGGYVYNGADVQGVNGNDGNILDELGDGEEQGYGFQGFEGPLAAGAYTIWLNQGAPDPSTVTFDLVTAAVGGPDLVLSISGAPTVTEAEGAVLDFTLTASDAAFAGDVEVTYDAADQAGVTQTVTFADGTATLSIPVANDDVFTGDATLSFTLTGATNLAGGSQTIGIAADAASASGTVLDDEVPPFSRGDVVAAFNAGGPALTTDGVAFAPGFAGGTQTPFSGGDNFTDGGGGNGPQPVFDGTIYKTEINDGGDGNFTFSAAVEPGQYFVDLYFAEIYTDAVGERVFDVFVEGAGEPELASYDIVAETGDADTPVVVQLAGPISPGDNGAIDLSFVAVEDRAKVSGVVIREAVPAGGGDTMPTVTLTPVLTTIEDTADVTASIKVADIAVTGTPTPTLGVTGEDAGLFEIVLQGANGPELHLAAGATLDDAANPSLDVTVTAENSQGSASGEVAVAVTDGNEAPTIALVDQIDALAEDVDTSGGTTYVAAIEVSDDELGTNELSLSGDDAALFTIVDGADGPELHLVQGAVLDFETNPDLDVIVAVDDAAVGGTPDDTAAFALTLTDVTGDELTAPTVALTPVLTTIEDTADVTASIKVADIAVTGSPAPELTLSGDDAGLFEVIDGAAGPELHLAAGATLDDAANPSLDVTVTATNSEGSATGAVAVAVTDGDDDNAAPTTSEVDAGTVGEAGAPVTIDLLANAADTDGDVLSVENVVVVDENDQPVTAVLNGASLSIDPSQFAADLGAGQTLALSVIYDVVDGQGGVTPGLATLVVEGADDAITWYLDRDLDGFGVDDPSTNVEAVEQPADPAGGGQYVALDDDADDDDATVFPGAPEINDGLDNDQDGETDEDNTAPTAADPAARETPVGETLTIALADLLAGAEDADGDALSVTAVTATNGTAELDEAAGEVRFTPAAGYEGAAAVTFTVSDGFGGEAQATVDVTVTGDDAGGGDAETPLALADDVSSWGTGFGSTVQDLPPPGATAPSVEGNSVTLGANNWKSVALAAPLTVEAGSELRFDYTATGIFEIMLVGFDSDTDARNGNGATYQIGGTDPYRFATSQAFNEYDAPGNTASFAIPLDALVGETVDRLVLVQDQDARNPTVNAFEGTFSNLRIAGPGEAENEAPEAAPDTLRTAVGEAVEVGAATLLANDSDPEDTALTLASVGGAVNGSVALADGVVTFTPAEGFEGDASFTYTVEDEGGATATATVTVTVAAAGGETTTPIDFSAAPIRSYTADQDVTPEGFSVGDGGASLTLTGNTWKRIALPGGDYAVTDGTTLAVTLSTLTGPGEIVAIGVEADNNPNNADDLIFQLAGTQNWRRAIDLRGQDDGGVFEIDLSALAGSSVSDLVLIADEDRPNADLSVRFEDVALVEAGGAGEPQAPRPASGAALPDIVVDEDGVLEVELAVIDPDTPREDLEVVYGGLPEFVQLTAGGLELSGTPVNADVGDSEVTVTVTDPEGNVFAGDFTLTVTNTNDPTEVVGALEAATAVRGAAVNLPLTEGVFVDPDADETLTYSATGLPAGLEIDAATGAITGTATEAGLFTVVISATDGESPEVSAELALEVSAAPPGEEVLIEAEDFTGLGAAQGFFDEFDADASGDQLIRVNAGQFGSVATDLGAGGVTPGTYDLTVVVFDENDGASTLDVEIVAADGTRTSVGQVAFDRSFPGQGNGGQAQNQVEVSLGAVTVPAGATLVISGQADARELLRVDAVRLMPLSDEPATITSPDAFAVAEDTTAVGQVTATDPEGGDVTYAIAGGADGALFSIDPGTGQLSFAEAPDFEAPADQGGDNAYEVMVSASDGVNTTTQAVTVTVQDGPEGPVVLTTALDVDENQTAAGQVEASGSGVSYAITGGADEALFSIDPGTGALSFAEAPDFEAPADQGGDNAYEVEVTASAGGQSDAGTVTVTVGDVDEAPTLSVADASVAEGETAVATATATDPEGATLTFDLDSNAGDNALFAIDQTGAISFVEAPEFVDGGDNAYDVTVSVSDGANTTEQSITVTVTDGGPAGPEAVLRINAFGPEVAVDGGPNWLSDDGLFTSVQDRGDAASNGNSSLSATNIPDGVPAEVLETARSSNGDVFYAIPATALGGNGDYTVNVYLAELFNGNKFAGDRVFDVAVEGVLRGDDVDPNAAGGGQVTVLSYDVTVDDGTLNLDFLKDAVDGNDNVIVNAIEVLTNPDGVADEEGPTAAITLDAPTEAQGTLGVAVALTDASGVDAGSLGDDDVVVTVGGVAVPAANVSFEGFSNGTASYAVTAPAGGWADGAGVEVTLQAGAVLDGAANGNAPVSQSTTLDIDGGGGGVSGAEAAFASQNDLDTSQSYGANVAGSAVLEVMTGVNNIQSSNFGADSFTVTNTGGKKISAIYIDVNDALYPDSVFDPDGQGGDSTAKPWQVDTSGGTGAYIGGGVGGYFDAGPDPIPNTTGVGGPSNGGFKGAMVKFNPNASGGFQQDETVGFSGDMDPNSIAGLTKASVDGTAIDSWDVGGISGHEIIGSTFTVLFDDGTTASGELASDGSAAGSQALATQDASVTEDAPGLQVDGINPGSTGSYGGEDRPTVVVTGDAGDLVRITLTKGFNPVTETSNGIATLVENRLDRYDFQVNNAFDVQTVTVTIGDDGTFDASSLFDYDDAPANNVQDGQFPGDDVQPIGFVATKVQAGGANLPISPTTAPIYLTNQGGPVTGDPTDGGGGTEAPEGYFAINGSGSGAFFKVQVEDGTGGTNPGGKWTYLEAPDGAGRQANFGGDGYYLFGSETSTGIDTQVGGNELLEYTIFVPEGEEGVYDFRIRASRDGQEASDQQNDIWWNFKEADQPGNGDVEAFLTEASDEAEPVVGGFVKLFGGPNNGNWGYANLIDGVTATGNNNGNFGAQIAIEEAGLYTIQLDGRSQGFHVDWWELNKTGGSTPGTGAADSAFVEGEPDTGGGGGGGSTGGGGTGGGAGEAELVYAVDSINDDWEQRGGGTSGDLELGLNGDPQSVGIRFDDVEIPDGADILNAFIRFEAFEDSSGPASFTIEVEDGEDVAPYTGGSTPDDRAYVDQTATWTPGDWDEGEVYETVDLTALIEAAVGADGTEDGALGFRITGSGGRVAHPFGSDGDAPELVIQLDPDSLL